MSNEGAMPSRPGTARPPALGSAATSLRLPTRHVQLLVLSVWLGVEVVLLLSTDLSAVNCQDFVSPRLCLAFRIAKLHASAFVGAFLILMFAHPSLRNLLATKSSSSLVSRWLLLQSAGFTLVMVPWALAAGGWVDMRLSAVCWFFGGIAFVIGTFLSVAGPTAWRNAFGGLGWSATAVLVLGALGPALETLTQEAWHRHLLARMTFYAVGKMLAAFGVYAATDSSTLSLSTETFSVIIAPACSGFEGFGLILMFLACYFLAFRETLRFPQVWLLVPIGLTLSWLLDVARLTILFSLGSGGHADLAVKGFHSHAGWLIFCLLAVGIMAGSRAIPWFRRAGPSGDDFPLAGDWTAALILPFTALVGTSLLLSTFTLVPDLWYGVKVIVMSCALLTFAPLYSARLSWQLNAWPVVVGCCVGTVWILGRNAGANDDPALDMVVGAMPSTLLFGWIAFRLVGTALLVPIIEELFFRGYILGSLAAGTLPWRVLGLAVSTCLFATFHHHWMLAAFAGLIYGSIYLRTGRVTDAIVAHMASNIVIGLFAAGNSEWALI